MSPFQLFVKMAFNVQYVQVKEKYLWCGAALHPVIEGLFQEWYGLYSMYISCIEIVRLRENVSLFDLI